MIILVAQLVGVAVFLIVTVVLGMLLRSRTEPEVASAVSRISHMAFWLGLVVPWTAGLFYPGPSQLDHIVGVSPMPLELWVRVVLGVPPLVAGVVLMRSSMAGLRRSGKGAPAFKLTSSVVSEGVYGWVRNPMALGYYLGTLGGALLSGSTYLLLYTAVGVIAAHVFNLKFFEELELSLRYGDSYEQYKRDTPFLVPRVARR